MSPFVRRRQSGVVLVIALVLLLLVTIVGIAAARTQVLEVRMAGNMQNRTTAMQSAEAALRIAEGGLLQNVYRKFADNSAGQYFFDPNASTPAIYLTVNWSDPSQVLTYSGPAQSSSNATQPPVFIIEQLPTVTVAGESISMIQYGGGIPSSAVYRVTAYGSGTDSTSTVRLQSTFH